MAAQSAELVPCGPVAEHGAPSLALLLSRLPVVVLDGSTGGDNGMPARIVFVHRGSPHSAALFAADLVALLAPHEEVTDHTLSVNWRAGIGEPVFQLSCPPENAPALACALSEAAATLRELS
jgi:hypothetical protein